MSSMLVELATPAMLRKAQRLWDAYAGPGPYPPWDPSIDLSSFDVLEKARQMEGRGGHWATIHGAHVYLKDTEWIPRKNKVNRHERSGGQGHGMHFLRDDKRMAIYHRDGAACGWCGAKAEHGNQLTADHLIDFQAEDGTHHESNLVTCCHRCNSVRKARDVHKFAKDVAGYINHDISDQDILGHLRSLTERPLDYTYAREQLSKHGDWPSAVYKKPDKHVIARRLKAHSRVKDPHLIVFKGWLY